MRELPTATLINFNYIIGKEIGGYAGKLEPGNVAAVLGEKTDILNGMSQSKG